jgi:hypothetical protein
MLGRISAVFAFLSALTPVSAIARAAPPPATRPTVPPLIVGAQPPKSFVVTGVARLSPEGGMAFRVATDGVRQVCALYDPADGTPMFLSDGQQTLVYDLANSRVVRVPVSRGNIRVEWDAQKEKPLTFSFAVACKPTPEKLDEANAWFRIDRFLESAGTLERLATRDNTELWAAERKGGSVESVQLEPGDARWFRFTSTAGGASFYGLELYATGIGEQPPANALAFPDVKRLAANVRLMDLDEQMLPAYLVVLRDGRAWLAKMGLAAGPTMRESAAKVMRDVDWGRLRERDETFGAAYRKALAEQGVELPTYPQAGATQPTR